MNRLYIRRLTLAFALLIACAAAALHQPRITYACSCAPPPPPQEAMAGAAAVFAGTVSGIAPAGAGGLLVTFDLQQSWKGPAEPQLTITTSDNSASCGVAFSEGESYLVYGFAQDGQLATNLCSRTAPLANAGDDLATLGDGAPVTAAEAPVTETTMDTPWLPIALIGGALVLGLVLFGPSLLRRRR